MLETCPSCHGFLPPRAAACPHCDHVSPAERALGAAGAAMMVVTLMACYAAYDPYDPDLKQPDGCPVAAQIMAGGGPSSGDFAGAGSQHAGTCVGRQGCERAFELYPDSQIMGKAGTFTIHWASQDEAGVYVRSGCMGPELACASATFDGELEFHVDAAAEMTIFIDSTSPWDYGSFQLSVDFSPDDRCGNGIIDSLEQCDDGSSIELGEGCSWDCQVEPCALAEPVEVGLTTGDTSLAANLVMSPCTYQTAPEDVYSFTPAERGTVTFSLDPESSLELRHVLSCADSAGSGCSSPATLLSLDASPDQPLYVVVSGGPQEGSPYGLTVEFVPSCGDGVLDHEETCDDGDQTPGDGCDEACHTEPAFFCAQATPLAMGDNVGDTQGGSHVFASCDDPGSPQRYYSWTAPEKGVLILDLASQQDLVFAVAMTCGGSWIHCAAGAPAGETELASIVTSAGSSYFITVGGQTADAAGPFTLAAQFIPVP